MLVSFIALNVIVGLVSAQSTTVAPSSSTSSTPFNSWQNLFDMAIRGMNEFSRVCIVSSRQDYTITLSPTFTYLQYTSYRTSLTQATDVVDSAFRNAEMSMSRVKMTVSQISSEMEMVETILTQASAAERKIFLPTTLKNIARMLTDAASVIGSISTEFGKVVGFFDELLRAVQPTPPSSTTPNPSRSTTTQANKSPLDIDHPVALSNILNYFKSLTAAWNEVSAFSNKAATQATGVLQFVNDIKGLLRALSDVDDAADLLDNLSEVYTQVSMKRFTPRTITIVRYTMLSSESERLTAVTTLNDLEVTDLPKTARLFAQLTSFHQAHISERNERYNNLIASASSTTPSR